MRSFLFTLILMLLPSVGALAQDSEICKDLDMGDAAAIVACLESDERLYTARTKPLFEPNQKCEFMQMMVVKQSISTVNAKAGKRINSKDMANPNIERPSCETISEVVALIHGRPASWSPCLGYEEAEDKFGHFKYCLIEFQRLRYGQPNRKIGKMECKRAVATYQQAFSQIYPPRQDQGEYYGRRVPSTYIAPDCAQVDAFFNAAYEAEMAEFQKQHQEQMALKAQLKAGKAAAAKELAAKKKKVREHMAKMEESYQNSLDEMGQASMDRLKNAEHPKGAIDEKQIRHAMIKEVWDMMPEARHEMASNIAKIVHTTAGFKTWTNNKMAPNIYHAVKSAKIKNCDVRGDKAHCTYDVTVSSSIDYHGMQNQQQREVYNKLGDLAGGGPRTFTLESDFIHDGQQWKAKLDYNQAKQLMPPEIQGNANAEAAERERAHCDIMSTLSGWPVC